MNQLLNVSVLCAALFSTTIVKAQEVIVTNKSDRSYTVELNFANNGLKAETFTLKANDGEKKLVIPAQSIRSLIFRDTRALRPQSMDITEAKLNHNRTYACCINKLNLSTVLRKPTLFFKA